MHTKRGRVEPYCGERERNSVERGKSGREEERDEIDEMRRRDDFHSPNPLSFSLRPRRRPIWSAAQILDSEILLSTSHHILFLSPTNQHEDQPSKMLHPAVSSPKSRKPPRVVRDVLYFTLLCCFPSFLTTLTPACHQHSTYFAFTSFTLLFSPTHNDVVFFA